MWQKVCDKLFSIITFKYHGLPYSYEIQLYAYPSATAYVEEHVMRTATRIVTEEWSAPTTVAHASVPSNIWIVAWLSGTGQCTCLHVPLPCLDLRAYYGIYIAKICDKFFIILMSKYYGLVLLLL